MTHLTITAGPYVKPPRGASWAAEIALAASRLVKRLQALRRERTPAEEAEAVRRLARSYQRTDPGLASDLFAAADRHLLLHESR